MKRIPSLDGLRAIAIFLVVISHATFSTGFPKFLIPTCQKIFNGDIGVSIFFSLSGFLITRILLDEYKSYLKINLINFYIKRIFRILPVFYFYLILATLADYLMNNRIDWHCIKNTVFFTYNFSISCNWIYAHSWSLSIEEQFYLLMPIIIYLKFRLKIRWYYVFALILLIALFLDWYIEVPNGILYNIFKFFLRHSSYLFFGVVFSVIYFYQQVKIELILKRLQWMFYPLTLIVFIQNYLTTNRFSYYIIPMLSIILPISVCILILLSIINTNTLYYKFLNQPQIVYIGKISYSLYLWQQLFIFPASGSWWRSFPVNIVMALICAVLSYYYLELPSMKARKIFLRD